MGPQEGGAGDHALALLVAADGRTLEFKGLRGFMRSSAVNGLGKNYLIKICPTMPASVWPGMVHFKSPKCPVFMGTNHHSVTAFG